MTEVIHELAIAVSDRSVEPVADPQCLVNRKIRTAIHGKIVHLEICFIHHRQAN
ncbi:MAG TPA: hypothetical protein VFN98_07865 [Nitrososphaeraceae archaeon]|nr:hypothetical protein [Nitrososphaeraceae archaeon]